VKHDRFTVSVAAAILTATAACAAQMSPVRPLLVPDRDVTVDYRVSPEGRAPIDVVVAISAGGRRLHITSEDLPTTILVDRDTETAEILLPLLRAYAELRIGRYDPERTILHGAGFTRGPERAFLGRRCTEWRAVSQDGHASACITPDGVILQGAASSNRRGDLGAVQARRVTAGTLPAELFQVPPDFQKSPFRFDPQGQAE
jgi:hypothetical protein